MNALTIYLNGVSAAWWGYVEHSVWQSGLVGVLVLAAVWLGRRWPAPLRYGLLLLALVKFAVPPVLPVSLGLFGLAGPRVVESRHAESDGKAAPLRSTYGTKNLIVTDSVEPTFAAEGSGSPFHAPVVKVPTVVSNIPLCWQAWCMLAHLAVTLSALCWLVWQCSLLRGFRRRARLVDQSSLMEEIIRIGGQLGLRRPPVLAISGEVPVPVAFGLIHPVVMLPARSVERLPVGELRNILGHELAHIRRRDLWVNMFQLLLQAIWWFHPVLWLLNRALRSVREDCCDDLVLAKGLATPDGYTGTLLRAALELAGPLRVSPTVAFAESLHPLGARLARLMDRSITRSAKLSFAGLCVLICVGALVLPGLRSRNTAPLGAVPSASVKGDPPLLRGAANPLARAINDSRAGGKVVDYPASRRNAPAAPNPAGTTVSSGRARGQGFPFTVTGQLSYKYPVFTNPPPFLSEGTIDFTAWVDGGLWAIRTKDSNNTNILYTEVGCDGKDHYTLDRFADWHSFHFMSPDGHEIPMDPQTRSNTPAFPVSAMILAGVVPDLLNASAAPVWLAFASGFYLGSITNGSVLPLWHVDNPWLEDSKIIMNAQWESLPGENGLPKWLRGFSNGMFRGGRNDGTSVVMKYDPPFDKGFLSAAYTVVSTTNFDGRVLPVQFKTERFTPTWKGATTNELVTFLIFKSRGLAFHIGRERTNYLPELPAHTILVDERRTGPHDIPAFYNDKQIYHQRNF